MQIPKVVASKVAFIEELESLFCSSEVYLEPDWIPTMELLGVTFAEKLHRTCSTGF